MTLGIAGMRSLYHQARILGSIAYHRFLIDHARDCDRSHLQQEWNFTSEPEQLRYSRVMKALLRARPAGTLGSVLEIGCSEGVFTTTLARYCRTLLAVDISGVALERATRRCAGIPNVIVRRGNTRDAWESDAYDVIVAMCVWEYLQGPDQHAAAAHRLVAALRPGGVLLVNSTRLAAAFEDAWWARCLVVGGTQVVRFITTKGVSMRSYERFPDYVIATFVKAPLYSG